MEKLFTKLDMIQFKSDLEPGSNTDFATKYGSKLNKEQMIDIWFEEFEQKSNKHDVLESLIFEVRKIYFSDEKNWQQKFDRIFSDDLSGAIYEIMPFDYYDPDMDYEDDLNAYVGALEEAYKKFLKN